MMTKEVMNIHLCWWGPVTEKVYGWAGWEALTSPSLSAIP